jgi:hypothetical protein
MVLGFALTPVLGPVGAGLAVGGIQTARTGDIGKGIMAGLGAYGGAGLGEGLAGLGANSTMNQAVTGNLATNLGAVDQAITGAGQLPDTLTKIGAYPEAYSDGISMGLDKGVPATYTEPITYPRPPDFATNPYTPEGVKYMQQSGLSAPEIKTSAADYYSSLPASATPNSTNAPVMGSQYLGDVSAGVRQLGEPGGFSQLGTELMGPKAYGGKMGAAAAGIGALGALGALEQPQLGAIAPQQQASNYRAQRPIQRPYDPSAPGGYYFTDRGILQPAYAAKGGEMHSVPELEDGGFVLTKKAVDGLGKGSNERGQRAASAGLGAIPIKGPGTGTSDSIPTTIDGKRPALLSNGEAYVPRDQVKRRGGAKKFYALMKQAEREAARRA